MKRLLIVVSAALGLAGVANAADMAPRSYTKAAPMASPMYNWSGFYIGAMGGYGWSDTSGIDLKGGFGGGTVGYNWQSSNIIFGIEGEGAWSDISQTVGTGAVSVSDRLEAFGSVTGRLGYAIDNVLLYGKGGYAVASNRISATAFGLNASETRTHSGWTAGGGVEVGFWNNWSVKGEYLYAKYDSENYLATVVPGGLPSGELEIHTVKAGLNYRFGGPAVPRF